ncbi:hypothetical protein [Flavobacterium luteolum]|uniref:hypothetical protein n=1 Tax=Flavobacterium luteolum TaxID=3003259 RepID=UPI00248DF0C0|nr:hypothetical protein [Flavobacterium luteolum]
MKTLLFQVKKSTMQEIDYFKGVSDNEFIDYYKLDLFSRMEITIYTYPHEFVEEDPQPWEHLKRCEMILYEYLYNTYESADHERWLEKKKQQSESQDEQGLGINSDQIEIDETPEQRADRYALLQKQRDEIVKAKMQQLMPQLSIATDEYLAAVKLTFVDL